MIIFSFQTPSGPQIFSSAFFLLGLDFVARAHGTVAYLIKYSLACYIFYELHIFLLFNLNPEIRLR